MSMIDPFEVQVPLTHVQKAISTPEDFKAWLLEQPDNRAYERSDTCKCPIATYFNEKVKENTRVELHGVRILYDVPGHYCRSVRVFQLPLWMRLFICKWDNSKGECPTSNLTAKVMMDEVLNYLENKKR